MQLAKTVMNLIKTDSEEPLGPSHSAILEDGMSDEGELNLVLPLHRWRRFVLLLGVAMTHAASGLVLEQIETVRERLETLARQAFIRSSKPEARAKLLKKTGGKVPTDSSNQAPKVAWAKGKAMPRSISSGAGGWTNEPETCTHVKLSNPRGGPNGTKWLTCLLCGSRWERHMAEAATSSNQEFLRPAVTRMVNPDRLEATTPPMATAPVMDLWANAPQANPAFTTPRPAVPTFPMTPRMTEEFQMVPLPPSGYQMEILPASTEDQIERLMRTYMDGTGATAQDCLETVRTHAKNEADQAAITAFGIKHQIIIGLISPGTVSDRN
jgi:hypothetical protein